MSLLLSRLTVFKRECLSGLPGIYRSEIRLRIVDQIAGAAAHQIQNPSIQRHDTQEDRHTDGNPEK